MGPVGRLPKAPGTWGSAAALAAAPWCFMPLALPWRIAALGLVLGLGTLAAARAEKVLGRKDPGCVVVPAAWTVALREGLRGHAMLRAVLWGFEAATRVGMAVGPAHYRIWHNTATCGPYGSAMAAAATLVPGRLLLTR